MEHTNCLKSSTESIRLDSFDDSAVADALDEGVGATSTGTRSLTRAWGDGLDWQVSEWIGARLCVWAAAASDEGVEEAHSGGVADLEALDADEEASERAGSAETS